MAIMVTRKYRCRQSAAILFADIVLFLLCCISVINTGNAYYLNLQQTRRTIDRNLEENLKLDQGKGCVLPRTDPFSNEAIKFKGKSDVIECPENIDWVKCYHSTCRVVKEILNTTKDIYCMYQDIIYHSDARYMFGRTEVNIIGDKSYNLNLSDHVTVTCYGTFEGCGRSVPVYLFSELEESN